MRTMISPELNVFLKCNEHYNDNNLKLGDFHNFFNPMFQYLGESISTSTTDTDVYHCEVYFIFCTVH